MTIPGLYPGPGFYPRFYGSLGRNFLDIPRIWLRRVSMLNVEFTLFVKKIKVKAYFLHVGLFTIYPYFSFLISAVSDHPWSGVVYNFGRFCMFVRLSDDDFRKTTCMKFIFARPVYLPTVQVRFLYEGHWVKVKVTGRKKVLNGYSCNGCMHWNRFPPVSKFHHQ